MSVDLENKRFQQGRLLRHKPHFSAMRHSGRSLNNVPHRDVDLIAGVQAALAGQPSDLQRASSFAIFVGPCGDVQKTVLLQLGTLNDVAFYERQVVELCFGYSFNAVVLVFYLPQGPFPCPALLERRFGQFANTLRFIEMCVPYVLWKVGDGLQVLTTDTGWQTRFSKKGSLQLGKRAGDI